jgi:mono/diheme cytochrome c family protein
MTQTQESPKKSRTLYFLALFAVVVFGSVALVYGVSNWAAEAKAKRLPNPVSPTKANVAMGKSIYMNHCVQCHGDRGEGKGQKSAELSVEPGNFTDARKMGDLTDGELYWQISKGRSPMPGFEDKLTSTERWQAVDYIRTFTQATTAAGSQEPAASK